MNDLNEKRRMENTLCDMWYVLCSMHELLHEMRSTFISNASKFWNENIRNTYECAYTNLSIFINKSSRIFRINNIKQLKISTQTTLSFHVTKSIVNCELLNIKMKREKCANLMSDTIYPFNKYKIQCFIWWMFLLHVTWIRRDS